MEYIHDQITKTNLQLSISNFQSILNVLILKIENCKIKNFYVSIIKR